jgi:hypothetical protein
MSFFNVKKSEDYEAIKKASRSWAATSAAKCGNLKSLKYLHSVGSPIDGLVLEAIIDNDHIACLEWIVEERINNIDISLIRIMALTKNKRKSIDWVHEYEECQACALAAKTGNLQYLQRLHRQNYAWNDLVCSEAILNGHFELLKWARANGAPWNRHAAELAAISGNIEMYDWIIANGAYMDETIYWWGVQLRKRKAQEDDQI